MPHVACRDGRSARRGDPRNLHVPDVDGPPGSFSLCGHFCRGLRGGLIEWNDAAVEIFFEQQLKRFFQGPSPPPGGKKLETETDLVDRDRCGPVRFRWLRVEPCHDYRIDLLLHESRDHIRVE